MYIHKSPSWKIMWWGTVAKAQWKMQFSAVVCFRFGFNSSIKFEECRYISKLLIIICTRISMYVCMVNCNCLVQPSDTAIATTTTTTILDVLESQIKNGKSNLLRLTEVGILYIIQFITVRWCKSCNKRGNRDYGNIHAAYVYILSGAH